ncbi:MAG: protein kinase [Planctomycetota bacterium]|nr:protein kinase [Planctomycetota bacterium]
MSTSLGLTQEGYTIEHAVGRGGFGEVYYAVSDSGKQVALKAVQNSEDIELRGSTHCMNLKSPHLVTIFDVRHSERGDPFVIMEYVSGPSLRELLDASPEGLGQEKAAWFIREIAKAVSLLHDNGIVHRDLKPHNVFFEDGYVMVGDYSLSKVITTSHRSGHTLTVGTVHYMAPEISLGRYGRTVDIYAMGVLLYEMLTGKPPFVGESMGEVLMKHMSQEVDVSALPRSFATVVQKAMARDPDARYQSADEMVEALFGSDAVRDGASGFDPGSLTMIARRAVEKSRPTPATVARGTDTPEVPQRPIDNQQQVKFPVDIINNTNTSGRKSAASTKASNAPAYWLGQFVSRLGVCLAIRSYPARALVWDNTDELPFSSRSFLGSAVLLTGSLAINMLVEASSPNWYLRGTFMNIIQIASVIFAIVCGVLTSGRLLASRPVQLPWYVVRGAYLVCVGILGFVLSLVTRATATPLLHWNELFLALLVPLIIQDWRWLTSSHRCARLSVTSSLAAAMICAAMIAAILEDDGAMIIGIGAISIAAIVVQIMSPFSETGSRRMKNCANFWASLWGYLESLEASANRNFGQADRQDFAEFPAGTQLKPRVQLDTPSHVRVNSFDTDHDDSLAATNPTLETSARSSVHSTSDAEQLNQFNTDSQPKARMPALVLSLVPLAMMPVFGLHRFYVGKVFSGVLYLLTLGLFGVGQLVDVILIALGEFRDAEGRLLTIWRSGSDELSTVGEKVNSLSVVPSPRTFFSDGLTWLGGLALVATVLIGVALAIDVPKMIAVDVFRSFDLTGADLQAIFGTNTWPELLRELLQLLTGIMAVVTAGLLIASRRALGVTHLVRVPVAFLPFAATCGLLMEAFYRVSWERVANGIHEEKVGLILEEFLSHNDFIPCLIGAAVAFAVGLLILAWPPRREPVAAAEQVHTPVAQRH